jgi:hypothetical protein
MKAEEQDLEGHRRLLFEWVTMGSFSKGWARGKGARSREGHASHCTIAVCGNLHGMQLSA